MSCLRLSVRLTGLGNFDAATSGRRVAWLSGRALIPALKFDPVVGAVRWRLGGLEHCLLLCRRRGRRDAATAFRRVGRSSGWGLGRSGNIAFLDRLRSRGLVPVVAHWSVLMNSMKRMSRPQRRMLRRGSASVHGPSPFTVQTRSISRSLSLLLDEAKDCWP